MSNYSVDGFSVLSSRLISGIKLSCLFLGGCAVVLYKTIIRNKKYGQVHYGAVEIIKPDTNTAMVISGQGRRYCVDQQYFGVDTEPSIDIGTELVVIGEKKLINGHLRLYPSSNYFSGIYTTKHPICWVLGKEA